jgi:hypothetical protein
VIDENKDRLKVEIARERQAEKRDKSLLEKSASMHLCNLLLSPVGRVAYLKI